jgi:hypothetical protein
MAIEQISPDQLLAALILVGFHCFVIHFKNNAIGVAYRYGSDVFLYPSMVSCPVFAAFHAYSTLQALNRGPLMLSFAQVFSDCALCADVVPVQLNWYLCE